MATQRRNSEIEVGRSQSWASFAQNGPGLWAWTVGERAARVVDGEKAGESASRRGQ